MHYFKRSVALCACLALLLATAAPRGASAAVKEIKIHGYVTNVISPTSFEIDDYRITRDESVVLEFENKGEDVKFKPEDVRVGTEVEIRGRYDEATQELRARSIKVDLEQFRKFKMTAVLNRAPEGVEQTAEGWRGTFFPDGHRVRVEPTTQVLFKPNKSEEKAAAESAKGKKSKEEKPTKAEQASKDAQAGKDAKAGGGEDDDEDEAGAQPLRTLADVGPGMLMTYEGTEQPDGTILAARVVFMRNEVEKGEASLWKSLKLSEKPANLAEGKPAELKIDNVGKYKLLPNEEAQRYVARVGQGLVPSFQRSLADGDPRKLPFRFYVIIDKQPNAFALPNGVVVVHSGLFEVLENEAQLAAVLGHEIAHATQEHTWRQTNKDKKKRMALQIGGLAAAAFGGYGAMDMFTLVLAAMVNGYQRTLENQADRVGLEYLVDAGYDPREAPRVWKLMAKKYGDMPTDFFWSSHDNNVSRRSYLMKEIRNNYSQLEFDKLNRGSEEEFRKMAALVKEAAAKKKKIKVTT